MPPSVASRRSAPVWLFPALLVLAGLSLAAAVFLGVARIAPADVAATLAGRGSDETRLIVLDFRLARIVTGCLAGMHFAVAGLLLQSITRNPLADPSLMGVSQGATLAVTLFLLFSVYGALPGSGALAELPIRWLPAVGTLGGVLAGGAVYLLALRTELGPLRLTLCGIAAGAILHALAIGLIAGWGSARMDVLLEWLAGSLYARSWNHVVFLLPFTVAGFAVLPVLRRSTELLGFDAPVARSFGLAYRRYFSLVLLVACGLAASAVGAVGPIAFVGLVVPHLARFAAGRQSRLVLPLTVALGAIVVTLGDLAGRLAGQVEEIPIGVVTALFGVPVLVALLRRTA